MTEAVRWGILGTGRIARTFAAGLATLPSARLVAVGSRAQRTADEFADRFGVPHRHSTYDGLADDPDVDVVYVATPHPFHCENSALCLRAGKAVLCEKPFAINRARARQVVDLARGKGLFLMEAMWTRFLPVMGKVRDWLIDGAIGQTRMVYADFGFRAELNREGRLFNPELGGGALLDVGVYTLSFASMVFGGPPSAMSGLAHLGETGVDEQAAVVLSYPEGGLALLSCAVRTNTFQEAKIFGTQGAISIHPPFWHSKSVTLSVKGREDALELPYEGNGYGHQAAEVMRCLREGKPESEVMPLDETLSILETMDRLRAGWGLKYPMETSMEY